MGLLKILPVLIFAFSIVFCDETNLQCDLSEDLVQEIAGYQDVANKIIQAVTNGQFKRNTYNELVNFIDKFGNRIAGSRNLENAIDYMLQKLEENELDNVHGEPVKVPHWIRGEERAIILKPRIQKLNILGLGGSVGTSILHDIVAEAIVVTTFEELSNKSRAEVQGKIVVFAPDFIGEGLDGYSKTVTYRTNGATRASELGAVASLIRSITPFSISTLHTGWQEYEPGVRKIPTASISVEDAHLLKRLQDRGEKIVLGLKMRSIRLPDSVSRNTVAEIRGESDPDKVVLVSGHLDSWDVGQGAMDDGGGAFISWYTLVVLKQLGLIPKRTLRVVLWTAEEVGLVGAQAYADAHSDELKDIVFALESDEGTFTPLGLKYNTGDNGGCILREIVKLLAPINATQLLKSEMLDSDIEIFQGLGVPSGGLLNANDRYLWYHHTDGDTMDVEDPDALDKATALWAVVSYVLADLSVDFPREPLIPVTTPQLEVL